MLQKVKKSNGSVIPLGYFLDASKADISAVFFSNVATYGKVIALAKDPDALNYFVTARHGHAELNYYHEDYEEGLLDGLFVLHNPYARHPLDTESFSRHGIAQFYVHNGEFVVTISKDYLLERSCVHLVPR